MKSAAIIVCFNVVNEKKCIIFNKIEAIERDCGK